MKDARTIGLIQAAHYSRAANTAFGSVSYDSRMVAFDVYLNGKKSCTAGIGDHGVLTTILTWATAPPNRKDLDLSVGGLISPRREHLRWTERSVRVGDEVRVKIVERARVDRPRSRKRRNAAKELKAKKEYVKRLAKELGWEITMPDNK